MALKAKWLWRYLNEQGGLWKEVIECKYGKGAGRDVPSLNIRAHGCGFWKGIVDLWPDFYHITWSMGDGSKTSFWLNDWCTDTLFKDLYPSIFRIVSNPQILVKDQMTDFGNATEWNLGLRRDLYEWEEVERSALMNVLEEVRMDAEAKDHWRWRTSNGVFSVASFYDLLRGRIGVEFPHKAIWKSGAPAKVCFFCLGSGLEWYMDRGHHAEERIYLC